MLYIFLFIYLNFISYSNFCCCVCWISDHMNCLWVVLSRHESFKALFFWLWTVRYTCLPSSVKLSINFLNLTLRARYSCNFTSTPNPSHHLSTVPIHVLHQLQVLQCCLFWFPQGVQMSPSLICLLWFSKTQCFIFKPHTSLTAFYWSVMALQVFFNIGVTTPLGIEMGLPVMSSNIFVYGVEYNKHDQKSILLVRQESVMS